MHEQTLALIKPDAIANGHLPSILALIQSSSLTIDRMKRLTLTLDQAQSFYAEHAGKDFFPRLTTFMASGELVALVLSGEQAITRYRAMLGATNPATADPGTIRALYGTAGERNAGHGSDSIESARREIAFFFPEYPLH